MRARKSDGVIGDNLVFITWWTAGWLSNPHDERGTSCYTSIGVDLKEVDEALF
jgi:hypothetical protein